MSKFKVGDRVRFGFGHTEEIGTISRKHESLPDSWWVKLDSDGTCTYTGERFLTLIEQNPATQNLDNVLQLMQQAAKLSIDNGDFDFAIKILTLVQGKS